MCMHVCITVCVSFHFRLSKSEKSIEFTSDPFAPYLSCAASLLSAHSTLISLGSREIEKERERDGERNPFPTADFNQNQCL